MPFDLESAIAVRERDDGLLEKDSFDLSSAVPVETEIRAAKPKEISYSPPTNKSQANVELSYREAGKEVPAGLRAEWILSSPQAQTVTQTVLAPELSILQGIRGAIDKSGRYNLIDRVYKGIIQAEDTKRFYEYIPKAEKLPNWAKITADIGEDIVALGALGLGKGLLRKELLTRDISRKLEQAAAEFSDEVMANYLPSGYKSEEILRQSLKTDFKNRLLGRLTAPEVPAAEVGTLGSLEGEISPSILQNYASRKNLFSLLREEIGAMGERGSAIIPKVGQSVQFTNPDGIILKGVIKEIIGQRAIINMDGRQVVAVLSQLSLPKVEQAAEGKLEKQYYEMTKEEFGQLPIIKYVKDALKEENMTVSERDKIAEEMVNQGLMSIDDFNAITGKHGFGGVAGVKNLTTEQPIPSKLISSETDIGAKINYIAQWHKFRTAADWFAHENTIRRALEEGKAVPKNVLAEYAGEEWANNALQKLYPDKTTEEIINKGEELDKIDSEVTEIKFVIKDLNEIINKEKIPQSNFVKKLDELATSGDLLKEQTAERIFKFLKDYNINSVDLYDMATNKIPLPKEIANLFRKQKELREDIKTLSKIIPAGTGQKPPVEPPTIQDIIVRKISRSDLESAAERFWNIEGKDYYPDYKSSREWLQKEQPSEIAENLENSSELYKRYFEQFSDYQYPNEITVEDIVEAYQSGKLPERISEEKETTPNLNIENIPAEPMGTFWSPKQAKDIEVAKVFETANQRVTKNNKGEVYKARGEIITAYNTDPNLPNKLGLSPAELNKKMRSLAGYPTTAHSLEYQLNQGVPDQFRWVGITNSALVNKVNIEPKSIDKYFKSIKVGKGFNSFWDKPGEALRTYIINAILGIDTRLLFNDLSFIIQGLKAQGQYSPNNITISIADINPHTVAHEIGHYLDYKFARELGFSTQALSRITPNWKYLEKSGFPKEHIQWGKRFQEFCFDISNRSDIGNEYSQDMAEVFARFVAKFTSWVNKQATMYYTEDESFYRDKFLESDFRRFVKLLQEKAYIDTKFNIRTTIKKTSGKINMEELPPFGESKNPAVKSSETKLSTSEIIPSGEGQKPPVEPPETAVSGEPEGKPPKKKPLSERMDIINIDKERLKEVEAERERYKHRIRKFRGGYLAEELKEMPAYYVTKKDGLAPDEVLNELGLDKVDELVDYLKKLEAERKKLIQEIKSNKPEIVSKYETTIEKEKEKIREQERKKAFKEMKKMTKEAAEITFKIQKKAFKEGKKVGSEIRKQKYFGSDITPQQRKELYVVALKKGVIYTDYTGKEHDKLKGVIRYYKGASFDQLKEYLSNLSGDPENPSKLFKLYGDIDRDAKAMKIINKAKENYRDINKVEIYSLDPFRTIEKVSGIPVWADNVLADNTINVISAADDAMIDKKALEQKELDKNREGILSGSKASAELMRKFEKGEPLTPKEQKVANFLRSKYDALIKEANEMRALVGKKPIPYRKDYMTHIVEQNILNEFFKSDEQGMEGISQAQLDAIRKGDYTKGNMPFNRFAQKRLGNKTKYDAIGNYLKYLDVITKEIYYTPAISHVRKFIEYALDKQPNAYKSMDRMLNDLKGKTSIADQNIVGAIASSAPVKWMRSHIARSALVGNINFWATNLSNFAISYDELGNYLNIGMSKFLGCKEWRKFAFDNSIMLKGRSIDPDFIDKPVTTKLEEVVGSITNLIEYNNVGSTFVGAYLKGVEKLKYSKEKAIEYADAIARRTQVGYKKYELNAWMRSNSGMLMSQFQSWAFNIMNHILYDLGVANLPKDAASIFTDNKTNRVRWGALITLIATAITTNYIYEKLGLRKPLGIGSAIPSASGINNARYKDIGPVTVGKNVAKIFTAKKKETKRNALIRTATAFVPGGTQISRFMEGKVFPRKEKTKSESKLKSGNKLK